MIIFHTYVLTEVEKLFSFWEPGFRPEKCYHLISHFKITNCESILGLSASSDPKKPLSYNCKVCNFPCQIITCYPQNRSPVCTAITLTFPTANAPFELENSPF